MEEPELEEGEACYYKDDASIDPDIALSYIDEKLQSVLGHFQKDFEGGVSAENLGAKFGGYGSFLPTYQRSPSIVSQPKTPQRVQSRTSPRSPNTFPMEGTSQNSTVSLDASLSLGHGTASCTNHLSHNLKVPSGDVSSKQVSSLPSAQAAEKFPKEHETSLSKLVNPTDQRTLRVRIKVHSSNTSQNNTAIYSGLGLTSPSSSTGNSPERSSGMPLEYEETPDESPASVLKIMTSFLVPGGLLLSPLDDRLLCLISKDKLSVDNKPAPALWGRQEASAILVDSSTSMLGDGDISKKKKTKSVGKSEILEESKRKNCMDVDEKTSTLLKKNMEIEILENKHFLSNDLKLKPLSNSMRDIGDSLKSVAKASRKAEKDVPVKKRVVHKNLMKDRLLSSDLVKESLESMCGLDGDISEKQGISSSSMEKNREHPETKDVSVDLRKGGTNKEKRVPAPYKANSDVSKAETGSNTGTMDHFKQKVVPKATSHEEDEIKMPRSTKKLSFEGKRKSKGSQSNGKLASDVVEESLRSGVSAGPEDKKSALMDVHKVRDSYKDVVDTRLEDTNNQMDPLARSSGDRAKDSNLVAVKGHARVDKSKERSSSKKINSQLTPEAFSKETPNDDLPAKGPSSEMEMASVDPLANNDHWVGCDRCQKWRLLPYGTMPEQLPEKWLCSMINWLPGMNHCDISEQETTDALHALYQLQLPENQNNLQNYVDKTASGVNSADARYFSQHHQNGNSSALPNRGKKHKSKDTPYVVSNDGPIQSAKSKSSNDMKQPPLETNQMNKSNAQHLSISYNFAGEKHSDKHNEKHASGGDTRQKKLKSKRESNHYGHNTTKKSKTEGAFDNNNNYSAPEHGGDFSTTFATKAVVKDMQKHSKNYSLEGTKGEAKGRLLISVKKPRDPTRVSLDSGSLDMKTCNEREIYMKKRKSKDWQDSHHLETSRNGNHLPDSKFSTKEGSSGSEFRKEKKFRVTRTEAKESSTSKVGDIANQKGRVSGILLSGNGDNPVVRSIDKDQQPRKYRAKVSPQRNSDIDSLKRDLRSEQFSVAATSSTSKVSDSCKIRANFPEVKGSPVESVSSSPMRTSNLDKLSPTIRDNLVKDVVKHDDFPLIKNPRKSFDEDGNFESHRRGTARKERVTGVFHPEPFGSSAIHFRDSNGRHGLSGKAESSLKLLSEYGNGHLVNSGADTLERSEDQMKNHYDTVLFPQKSGKDSSLWSKDRDKSSGYNLEGVMEKLPDPSSVQEDLYPKDSLRVEAKIDAHHFTRHHEELNDVKHRCSDECSTRFNKEDTSVGKKGSGKWGTDSRREKQSNFREHGSLYGKSDALCTKDGRVALQQNKDVECERTRKSNSTQVKSRGGKSDVNQCYAGKQGSSILGCQATPGSINGSGLDVRHGASVVGDVSKVLKQPGNAAHHSLGHPINRGVVMGLSAPSQVKRDASSQTASHALKEAEDLKDYADHLKNSGFGFECNEAYFQAALKFLHGASLLENCNSESGKHGEVTQMQIYSNTAKLCEICAHEYEKCQEMASAALAYKCMEVAHMRVVYCKNLSTNRVRHDLQSCFQMVPQESPSSSASDIDNLNNQVTMDKAVLSKGVGSHAGSHVIVPRNRQNFVRLLDFTKDVNSAMEASRKSLTAFTAANVILEEAQNTEGIISVKRVIDFSFQNVEDLICLVQLAIEAISRQGFGGTRD